MDDSEGPSPPHSPKRRRVSTISNSTPKPSPKSIPRSSSKLTSASKPVAKPGSRLNPQSSRLSQQYERSTSPDELAGSASDDYGTSMRRQNSAKGKSKAYTASRSHSESHDAEEDSPDELDHTAHTFWRGDDRRSKTQVKQESESDGEEMQNWDNEPPPALLEESSRNDQERASGEDVDMMGNDNNVTSNEGVGGYAVEDDYDDGEQGLDDEDDYGAEMTVEEQEEQLQLQMQAEEERLERERKRLKKYNCRLVLRGHRKGVAQVKFSPDGKLVASCSADATIRVWDAVDGRQLHVLEGHLAGISTVAWSPDSKTIASGSDDKSIWLWNAITGKPYPTQYLGHSNYIYSLAFSPKGNMIVSGSYDEAVFLWDVRGARVMRSLPAHSDPVGGVDFVRDGTLIVSCAGDGLVRIWDTGTGQCLRTLVHEDNAPVSSVRFSPNGKFVLAHTLDSCVRLWNYVEGRCVKTYQGHANKKYSIGGAFGTYGADGDQAFVASGSEDGSIVLWDVTSKQILQRLEGHEGVVLGVDTMEKAMVTCGVDGTVRLWVVDEDDRGEELDEYQGDEGKDVETKKEDEVAAERDDTEQDKADLKDGIEDATDGQRTGEASEMEVE